MVFAVSDENGNILGLYRMPDATYFSIGVAVAKARNVAYFDNPSQLQPIDKIKGVPAGTALTARTFRYVSLPFFPEGIDINPPGPGSILTDGGVTKFATNLGCALPAKAFQSIQGYNDFNPNTNFHQVITAANMYNQNGVVLFPGSAPLYKDTSGARAAESARRRTRGQRRRGASGRRRHFGCVDGLRTAANGQAGRPGESAGHSPAVLQVQP